MKIPTFLLVSLVLIGGSPYSHAEVMTKEKIIAEAEKMADAQLASLEKNKKFPAPNWELGVLWAGMADFSKVSPKPLYKEALLKSGEQVDWKLMVEAPQLALTKRKFASYADDLCIGQAWLSIYEQTKTPAILEEVKVRLDIATDFIEEDPANLAEADKTKGDLRLWTWCDALFMAPAVHSHLSAITGEPKYLKAAHKEWWRASALLYDEKEHLYFRDQYKFPPRVKSKNGKKVFWARGNGWVIGGLARFLEYVPKTDPMRPKYEQQFKEMATKLASLQRADGTWSPSLLDYEEFPYSETSGTALNTFAMAWGINHGLLDEKTYRPVVEKAWAALLAARGPEGMLGYVQGVAHGPSGMVFTNASRTYGTGAVLMAAAQLTKLAPLNLPAAPQLTAAPPVEKKPTLAAPETAAKEKT